MFNDVFLAMCWSGGNELYRRTLPYRCHNVIAANVSEVIQGISCLLCGVIIFVCKPAAASLVSLCECFLWGCNVVGSYCFSLQCTSTSWCKICSNSNDI